MPVAVKFLSSARMQRPHSIEMFRHEVQLAAGLSHPGIVTLLDYGTTPDSFDTTIDDDLQSGAPYLVMELASGGTLAHVRKPQPFAVVRRVLLEVLDALAYAHARGVVHRDLKPANVLICTADDLAPGLKLADFGIARSMESSDEEGILDGTLSGSPPYMPPEQFSGDWRNYGPWTDLYALGCISYELISGRQPYRGASISELAELHRLAPVPRIFVEGARVPEAFEEWMRTLLQKRPEDRFRCAADAAWALAGIDGPETWSETHELGGIAHILDPESHTVTAVPTLGGVIHAPERTLDREDVESVQGTAMVELDPTVEGPENPAASVREDDGSWTRIESQRRVSDALPNARTVVSRDERLELSNTVNADLKGSEELAIPLGALPTGTPPPFATCWRDGLDDARTPALNGVGLELYGLRPVPLVGREPERDTLWQGLRSVVSTASPQLVALHGEPGVGKSRLGRWFCERAQEIGAANVVRVDHSVANGPSDGLERAIARILRVVGLSRSSVRRRLMDIMPLGDRWSTYDVEAITEIVAPPEASERPVVAFDSRSERWVVMSRVIAAFTAERPLILWLDDLQWGAETLEMVRWWWESGELDHLPIFFLLTVRERERSALPRIYEAIEHFRLLSDGVRIDLHTLERGAHEVLVRGLLGLESRLAARVVERTDGNPLFAVQLVGDWVERGVLVPTQIGFELSGEAPAEMPESIHSLWASRLRRILDRFSGSEGRAIEVAALLGEQVERDEWRIVCDEYGAHPSDTLVAHLVDSGLVIPLDEGWRFAHDTLRELVERDLSRTGRRSAMHAAIASVLERKERPRDPRAMLRRAYHLEKSESLEASVELLSRVCVVAEEVSEYRLADRALDRMHALLAASPVAQDDARWGALYVARARLCARRSQFSEAESLLASALESAREHGWVEVEAAALEWSGFVARQRSMLPEAERLFGAARRAFAALEDRLGEARALRGAGWVSILQGRVERAHEEIERALALFEAAGDRYGVASSLRGLGDVERLRDRHQLAGDYFARAADVFEEVGSRHGVSECIHGQAEVLRYMGRLEEAAAGYRRSIAIDESIGARVPTIPRLNLGLVELARGEFDAARPALEFAYERFLAASQLGYAGCAAVCLLPCDASESRWEEWDARFEFAREHLEQTGLVDPDVALPAMIAAETASRGGQTERACRVLELALRQWNALGNEARSLEVESLLARLRD